ncbi:papain-like cysteine protease family protein [Prosthecomicrobium sp. N25]|uniref:papain-like cysteine protease family protein n=1 Tax=Prosthecomicrobium sp. N25 TaxID=3129254 RepID=UPI003077EBFE
MRYDVPLLRQDVSPICYVVSAAMIQAYWQGTAGTAFDTPHLTGGADPTNSCIPAAAVPGLYTERLERAGFALIKKPTSPFTKTDIDGKLRLCGPLLLNHFVANFNYGQARGGKQPANADGIHAVVITGIEGDRAFFNNPWGDKDVEIPSSDLLASIDQSYSHPYNALFYAVASPMAQNILD